MYKVSNEVSPAIISDIFKLKNIHPQNLRHDSQFSRHLVKTVFHGRENIPYLGPTIWDTLSVTYKELPNLEAFKSRIKK